jgi:hypothetical protein
LSWKSSPTLERIYPKTVNIFSRTHKKCTPFFRRSIIVVWANIFTCSHIFANRTNKKNPFMLIMVNILNLFQQKNFSISRKAKIFFKYWSTIWVHTMGKERKESDRIDSTGGGKKPKQEWTKENFLMTLCAEPKLIILSIGEPTSRQSDMSSLQHILMLFVLPFIYSNCVILMSKTKERKCVLKERCFFSEYDDIIISLKN